MREVKNIVVMGLGYVGLPLAIELAKNDQWDVYGFDINEERVNELLEGADSTGEVGADALDTSRLFYSCSAGILGDADVIIVTVPTPVTNANVPDLGPVIKATEMIDDYARAGVTVIYESTVYPGVTEEVCVPILQRQLGTWQVDFWVGYSPERINPGDKVNTLTTVTKVVSGDCAETLELVDSIYSSVTKTHRAPSIKVAEAAKVIENTQRDVNIALMNELSQIFTAMGVDTHEVLRAARTKWNFLPFTPGLVGGHCISVDPYYLTHAAASRGIVADVILSARKLNDSMAKFIATETLRLMANMELMGNTVAVLGCTFKENVPDLRNSKVFDLINHLQDWGQRCYVSDTHVTSPALQERGVTLSNVSRYQAHVIILAVPHEGTDNWDSIMAHSVKNGTVLVIDVKAALNREQKPDRVVLWRP